MFGLVEADCLAGKKACTFSLTRCESCEGFGEGVVAVIKSVDDEHLLSLC